MESNNKSVAEGRKNFLKIGAMALAGFLIGKNFSRAFKGKAPAASGEKIKMLTADGKLVEVDRAYIKKKTKVSDKAIMNWIHKNNA